MILGQEPLVQQGHFDPYDVYRPSRDLIPPHWSQLLMGPEHLSMIDGDKFTQIANASIHVAMTKLVEYVDSLPDNIRPQDPNRYYELVSWKNNDDRQEFIDKFWGWVLS